ncbi:MAG: TonB-dependent receptor plug domain-containing protein [Marinagarivorans sp.]|nr:TonB-dependent receptor plug domain-containing protein [Marinagarivorans sp.]
MYKKLALAIAVASSSGVVMADGAQVEEILVWGAQVKASSLKLDEEKIALKQVDHISDLLRIVPGVDVGGAHSLNQRITIRSMDDKDLRISIDGANQNTYMYHHMGNLQINADILKSVAIDVGTNSVVNGGLGGAVRFETRDAAELLQGGNRFGGRVNVSASDNASNNLSLTGYGKIIDSIDFLAYYNRVDRDNFSVGGGKIRDEKGMEEPGTDGEVKGLKGELDDVLIKFGWAINENHKLKLGYESYKDEGNYSYRPDMGLSTGITIANSLNVPLTYPTEFTRDTYTLNYSGDIGNTTIAASVYRNQSNLWRDETGSSRMAPNRCHY